MNQYAYESLIPSEKRTNLGIVYTPPEIVSYINEKVLSLWSMPYPPRVLDPCCGTGVFLSDMAQKISTRFQLGLKEVYETCVFGIDIDAPSVEIAKSFLPGASILNLDSLNHEFSQYDILVTNPPYVRIQNLSESARAVLKKEYSFCKGDTDIYMAFLEKISRSGKIAGLIFPNSWIKNKSADTARDYVSSTGRISEIIDFRSRRIFQSASTYTNILILDEKPNSTVQVGNEIGKLKEFEESLIFNGPAPFTTTAEDIGFVKEVKSRNTRLLDVAEIRTGLATLSDDVFCLEVVKEGAKTKILKKRGKKNVETFEIESSILKPCIRAGDITKNLDKKYVMIYPYDTACKPIARDDFKKKYPLAFGYLSKNIKRLKKRDKGKEKGYTWTQFGRTQGLKLTSQDKIVFATMIKDKMSIKDCSSGTTFVSGYCFIPQENTLTRGELKQILLSPDLTRWIKIFGKDFGNGWSGVSKETFKDYKIP